MVDRGGCCLGWGLVSRAGRDRVGGDLRGAVGRAGGPAGHVCRQAETDGVGRRYGQGLVRTQRGHGRGSRDSGRGRPGNAFQVRVRAGSRPRLDRILGFDGNTLEGWVVGLCVGPRSALYVLQTHSRQNRTSLRVFDKEGRYRRTLIPYPAATPPERTKSIGQVEVEGQRIPIVFDALGGNLVPLMAGMKSQRMVFSPKGYLLLASAVGSIMNHRPPRYLLAVHPDGGSAASRQGVPGSRAGRSRPAAPRHTRRGRQRRRAFQ